MSWLRFLTRSKWDEERARELQTYLEIESDKNIGRGLPPDEARHAAQRKLGNSTMVREEIYRMNSIGFLETFWQDVRFGLRMLWKTPGFTLVVILSLALGIGANTAIFTLVDAALLRMLPVKNPEQLIELNPMDVATGQPTAFSYPAYEAIRDGSKVFSGVFTFAGGGNLGNIDVEVDGHGGIAAGQYVSGNYFATLGVEPFLGRVISRTDDVPPSGNPVAVISYGYWKSRFGGDQSILGQRITLNNSPFTIVGVAPPEFFGMQPGTSVNLWVPLMTITQVRPDFAMAGTPNAVLSSPNRNWLPIFCRLKPGVTPDEALASVGVIYEGVKRNRLTGSENALSSSDRERILRTQIRWDPASKGLSALRLRFSRPLAILMAVVGLLLLIACANVANMLLARAGARHSEIVVRTALGAGRVRLLRQLMTESVLLALCGGALGMVIALWGSKSLLALMSPSASPILLDMKPDARVFGFTALVALLTALLFGLAPAWQATRVELGTSMKEGSGSPNGLRGRARLGKTLAISQVALSLVLLIASGLLVRSLENLKKIDLGFNANNTLLVSVNPSLAGYKGDKYIDLFKKLLERVRSTPGVQAASFSLLPPMTPVSITSEPKIVGESLKPADGGGVEVNYVGPDYFSTIGMPLVLGRGITSADQMNAPGVTVVNQTFAKTYFGETNPIGRRFSANTTIIMEIVGVVQDAKYHDPRDKNVPVAYVPFFQLGNSGVITFEIRTPMNATSIVPSLRQEIDAIDSRIPVLATRTLIQTVNQSFVQERLISSLTSLFGGLAVLLAAIGLYGLMAYTVTRRTNEIGIRIALGAQRPDVMAMVLRETFSLVAIGLAIGILASFMATRLIASELYGLSPADPLTIAAAVAIMISVASIAVFVPAWRASRVEPIVALRYE
ncbi:MAG TPA: ABC transporter permease [Candidatus Acidoferrales bacterium]|nr:ABC transporter permease [Candidatus Acidoferrales bacterium]